MQDRPQTPESVAYQLMSDILSQEKGYENERAYRLDLFAECLSAVKGHRAHTSSAPYQEPRVVRR